MGIFKQEINTLLRKQDAFHGVNLRLALQEKCYRHTIVFQNIIFTAARGCANATLQLPTHP